MVGRPIFITWRLYGTLPEGRAFSFDLTSGQAFVAMDRLLDEARTGPSYMRRAEIVCIVSDAIEHWRDRYELYAWVVMANHVHILITPTVEVAKITKSLKWFTAREANKVLGLKGPFWQDESYDRLVRNPAEFERIRKYIEWNPVRAGLVKTPEEYPWSSASWVNES